MDAMTLHRLPAELRAGIINYIHRPSDLKHLCLTCRELRDSAVPKLYKDVTIDLDKCVYPDLNGFFHPSNLGRQYVRNLEFEPEDPKTLDAWKIMRFAIELLPRNSLKDLM